MTTYDTHPAAARTDGDDRNIALLNYVLLLLGFFTSGITSLVAVVLAYARRGEAEPLARSHMGFQISTFWIGVIGTLAGIALMLASIAPFIMAGMHDENDFATVENRGLALAGIALLVVGVLVLVAAAVATLVRSIYGLIRLSSNQPMGGRLAEPARY